MRLNLSISLKSCFIGSLLDHFDGQGSSRRFDLMYVDHSTQERIIKDSGYWVKEMIKAQG